MLPYVIKMGRYPPRTAANHRYCKQCNTHKIDDEFHFYWCVAS